MHRFPLTHARARMAPAVLALSITLLVALQGTARAQTYPVPPPTVTVDAGVNKITVQGAGSLLAGPTTFRFTTTAPAFRVLSVYALNPGVTADTLLKTVRAHRSTAKLGSARSGSVVTQKRPQIVTFTVQPSTRYVVIDQTGERESRWHATEFSVGAEPNGAVAPTPVATVTMRNYRFEGAAVLPRKGLVRFENAGPVAAWATAFKIKSGVTTRQIRRAMRRSPLDLTGLVRNVKAPLELHGMIDPGIANDVQVSLPKRGRYLLMCARKLPREKAFYLRGMWRLISVK